MEKFDDPRSRDLDDEQILDFWEKMAQYAEAPSGKADSAQHLIEAMKKRKQVAELNNAVNSTLNGIFKLKAPVVPEDPLNKDMRKELSIQKLIRSGSCRTGMSR